MQLRRPLPRAVTRPVSLLVVLAWLALQDKRHGAAGIFGAPCLIKFSLTILPLAVLFFVYRGNWKTLLSFGITSLVLYLPPTLMLGWWIPDFLRDISQYASENAVAWDWTHAASPSGLGWLALSLTILIRSLKLRDADLAIGCTYKYLNGGPGAPGFLYVNKKIQDKLTSPIWGWWGQKNPFDFGLDYEPAPGAQRFLVGTQPMISLLTMEAALEPTLNAGMDALPWAEVDESFVDRAAYMEGRLTHEPDFSRYDDLAEDHDG